MHFNVLGVDEATRHRVNRLVHDVVASFGGSISAEHGIGQYRLEEAYRLLADAQLRLQERLKHALDPGGLLNPGKVFRRRPD